MTPNPGRYVPPAGNLVSFNCPHCGAFANQKWFRVYAGMVSDGSTPSSIISYQDRKPRRMQPVHSPTDLPFITGIHLSCCVACEEFSIWLYAKIVWPQRAEVPFPNQDLPEDIRSDYDEAASILDLSPRGSAALLRLAIQKLCIELGGKGKDINNDIDALVAKGLDRRVERALDVVRVIGNQAVHPGQIDLTDDRATAASLFGLRGGLGNLDRRISGISA